jgi:hypothetical protein
MQHGINFTKILQAAFTLEKFTFNFSALFVSVFIRRQKENGKHVAQKMLVNLTRGLCILWEILV